MIRNALAYRIMSDQAGDQLKNGAELVEMIGDVELTPEASELTI